MTPHNFLFVMDEDVDSYKVESTFKELLFCFKAFKIFIYFLLNVTCSSSLNAGFAKVTICIQWLHVMLM